VDPRDRYLRAWEPVPSCLQFDQQRVPSRFFSLLLPLPTAVFSTIMAKRKATAEELEARAESNGYKRGAYREKDSTRDNGKHNKKTKRNQFGVRPLRVVRDQCRANFDTDMLHTDPLRNAKRRASARSPGSRRSLCQILLSSLRSGGSRSSNDKGFFSILYRNELRRDRGGRFNFLLALLESPLVCRVRYMPDVFSLV
jgi:hypothetical protein